MTTYYAVYISCDTEEVRHVSVHNTYEKALKKLIEVTNVEQSWHEDMMSMTDEGDVLPGFEENYAAAKETLEHKDEWTLEQVQFWTQGENDITTCWIWTEDENG